jgi:glutamate-1-semialdehyde 2,1-aminomutase
MGGGVPAAALRRARRRAWTTSLPSRAGQPGGHAQREPDRHDAGRVTLEHCTDEVYATVDKVAGEIGALAGAALTDAGVAHRVQYAGNMFSVFFADGEVTDYASAQRQQAWRYKAFFHAMLARGVSLPPSAYEAWFVSAAHDEDAVARVAEALPHAARAAAEAAPPAEPHQPVQAAQPVEAVQPVDAVQAVREAQ